MRSTTNRSESSFIVKMLRNLVLILLLIVFISIVYNFRNRDSSTNVALLAEASASRSMRGVFIREEQVLTYSGSGALSYAVADGGKLGNGTVIANVYPNDEQIGIYREIESLTKQTSSKRSRTPVRSRPHSLRCCPTASLSATAA